MIFDYILMVIMGAIAGLAATIVPGPVAVICIQRTLNGNRKLGFVSGLGAATADAMFALIALFALSYVSSFLEGKEFWFGAIAGIIIMLVGFSVYNKKIQRPSITGTINNPSYASNYLSVLLMTIINPMYFAGFMLIFAALGIGAEGMDLLSKFLVTLGVLVGTSAWWFFVSWIVGKLRNKFSIRNIWRMNKISGVVIIVLGAVVVIRVILQLAQLIP